MSETSKRWRCPYCDGLNDWQNEVCEICGDGRRDEVEAPGNAEKAVEIPKTYTPPERKAEPEAPRREAGVAYAPPPPPAPEPKKKGGHGVLVAVVIVALASLGGRFLADSFVKSVEENKPTEAPVLVIETPVPTKTPASAEQREADASAPEAEQGVVAGQVIATFDVPDRPVASIESITLGEKGTALVKLRGNGNAQKDFTLYYCILKDQNEDPGLATWRSVEDNLVDLSEWHPRTSARTEGDSQYYHGPPEEPALVRVFPGKWMQFYVIGFGGFHNSAYWTTGPVYIPEFESAVKPPLRLTDVRFRYPDGENAATPYYTLTTAQDLNAEIEKRSLSTQYLWSEYDFRMDCSEEELQAWYRSLDRPKCCAVLYAPDFVKIGVINDFFIPYKGINGQTLTAQGPSVLAESALKPRDGMGWFPAGDYVLEFFIDGASVGSVSFTLAGKGGATSAGQAASASASAVFPLKRGSRGDEVKYLQRALMVLSPGFEGPADGIFGAKTQEAVYLLQDIAGYDHTGTVDFDQYRDYTVHAGVLPESAFQ